MCDAKSNYAARVEECLHKDRIPLVFGELRGSDEQLMKDTVFSSARRSGKFEKSFGTIEHLKDKVVADNK